MIGGRFNASVASIAAAGLFMGGVAAQAADLGGNCCADLEERVAELEATTARKGNRRVSVEVSGHVHEGILLWDDGSEDGAYIHSPNYSRSRFRFKGSAKINADWSAGFLMEFGLRQSGNSSSFNQGALTNSGLDIRHQALYLKSNSIGSVWLGHTSFAVDGVSDVCLGCPISSSHEANLGWGGFRLRLADGTPVQDDVAGGLATWAGVGTGALTTSNGARDQVLRYISPTIAGFVLSADTQLDEAAGDGFDSRWSAALRYAGEFGAIRVAGGIGYFEEDTREGFGGSLSMQHTPTGLFIAGTYEEEDDSALFQAGGRDTSTGWSVTGGVAGKWSTFGATTLWAKYAEYDGKNIDSNNGGIRDAFVNSEVISLGINQKIDAAAMELYVSYYHVSGDLVEFNALGLSGAPGSSALSDFDAVLFGARIQF